MYRELAEKIGNKALDNLDGSDLIEVPIAIRTAVKMGLKLLRDKVSRLTEEQAEKIIRGAIDALEEIKEQVENARERGVTADN